MKNTPLSICNITIRPGERITLALPTPELYSCSPAYIPTHIIHGKTAGPVLLVCGAMHGDEINGVAISQRLLDVRSLKSIKGTLIIIPTLNIYGLMTMSRNLPDRKDIEGSFPGSDTGSYASRLASFLTKEVFSKITHCIDLHTGEPHIVKYPQVRVDMNSEASLELAHFFQAPIVSESDENEGLIWLSQKEDRPVPTIIFEGGEGLRMDGQTIRLGLQGILRVMKKIGMLPLPSKKTEVFSSVELEKEMWVRAPSSGLTEIFCKMGGFVSKGSLIAKISDPFGTDSRCNIYAPFSGMITGKNNLPILNEGEPLLQIAEMKKAAAEKIEDWRSHKEGQAPGE